MAFGLDGYMEVLAISVIMSLATVLVSKFASNQGAIKNLKLEMKTLNARIKKAQKAGDTKEMNSLSSELMKLTPKQMQMSMKPMMISLMLFMAVFWFFGAHYTELVVKSPLNIPFIGNQLGWFHWYLIIVLPGSFLFRKLLAVE